MNCNKIQLNDLGKKYQNRWIFKHLDYAFLKNRSYAIKGPNGSGKSTLLKVLSGYLSPSRGDISYTHQEKTIPRDEVFKWVSFTAPYISLIDRLSLKENVEFMLKFQSLRNGLQAKDLIDICNLKKTKGKEIRYFSSGMMQRLKLATAICSDTDIILLDEPGTNLDEEGIAWYRNLMKEHIEDRIVIIASNTKEDFDFCDEELSLLDYKKL